MAEFCIVNVYTKVNKFRCKKSHYMKSSIYNRFDIQKRDTFPQNPF